MRPPLALLLFVLLAARADPARALNVAMSAARSGRRGGSPARRPGSPNRDLRAAAQEKQAKELQRRKAGVSALKQMAAIYKERARQKKARLVDQSASARAPPPTTTSTGPASSSLPLADDNLLNTLGALAAAQVEVPNAHAPTSPRLFCHVHAVNTSPNRARVCPLTWQLAVLRQRDGLSEAFGSTAAKLREAPDTLAKGLRDAFDRPGADSDRR